MRIDNIVTSLETSKKLKNAGYSEKAIFSYFKDKHGEIYISETDFSEDEHIVFAYTSSELIEILPNSLEISTETFVASPIKYINITEAEIEKYHCADLEMLRFSQNGDTEYTTKYAIQGRVIAFNRNLKGEYKNLICFGNNEVESRAKMILVLIEEEKL